MSLIFALGFVVFAFFGLEGMKDAAKYHNEYVGIGCNGFATCMSILAIIFCIGIFIFVELPLY